MAAIARAVASPAARLTARFLDKIGSDELLEIRDRVDHVLAERARQLGLILSPTELVSPPEQKPIPTVSPTPAQADLAQVLSPTQVRTFIGCSARWWFKYALSLPEPKTSALALGSAVHQALEANFREKLDTKEDLETTGVVALFRAAWQDQVQQTEFRSDEDPPVIGKLGEQLVAKYMDEAAPYIQPAAVELDVSGCIGGVPIRGKVDLLDVNGRLIDVKTSARKPSGVAPEHAFQLATYRQITPGASGEALLSTLVKTKTVQLVREAFTISDQDIYATRVLYPLVRAAIRSGLYLPNRQSLMCSRRNCAFWRPCQREFGGTVEDS